MLQRIASDPIVHEVIGRTFVNTVKLAIVAALFVAMQKQFYNSSNNLIETVDQGIAKLSGEMSAE